MERRQGLVVGEQGAKAEALWESDVVMFWAKSLKIIVSAIVPALTPNSTPQDGGKFPAESSRANDPGRHIIIIIIIIIIVIPVRNS
jgi:hypothetical protein